MFRRSPAGVSAGSTAAASFSTGRLSPVSALSPACRPFVSIRRRSAGTTSPAVSRTTSPGASSAASICCSRPPRTTRAFGLLMRRSASMARSARPSWAAPAAALITTISRIITGSTQSPFPSSQAAANESPAAASSTSTMKSVNCEKNRAAGPRRLPPSSSFRPASRRRRSAWVRLSPAFASVSSRRTQSCAAMACHSANLPTSREGRGRAPLLPIYEISPPDYERLPKKIGQTMWLR